MRVFLLLFILLIALPLQAQQDNCNGLPVVSFSGWDGDPTALRNGFCLEDPVGTFWYQAGLPDWQSHNALPVHFSTRAIWQNQGVIEDSAAYNNVSLEGYEGAIALNSCAEVGNDLWVRKSPAERWIHVIAADCVKREHLYHHAVYVQSGIELQWELADALGMFEHDTVGIYGFEVCLGDPAVDCAGAPVDYSQYFLEHLQFE